MGLTNTTELIRMFSTPNKRSLVETLLDNIGLRSEVHHLQAWSVWDSTSSSWLFSYFSPALCIVFVVLVPKSLCHTQSTLYPPENNRLCFTVLRAFPGVTLISSAQATHPGGHPTVKNSYFFLIQICAFGHCHGKEGRLWRAERTPRYKWRFKRAPLGDWW